MHYWEDLKLERIHIPNSLGFKDKKDVTGYVTHVTNEREKSIYSATHGTVEFKSTTELYSIKKPSKTKHKSVVCEYLLILVISNLPVSIPNPNNVEESYKTLISQKTNLEKS